MPDGHFLIRKFSKKIFKQNCFAIFAFRKSKLKSFDLRKTTHSPTLTEKISENFLKFSRKFKEIPLKFKEKFPSFIGQGLTTCSFYHDPGRSKTGGFDPFLIKKVTFWPNFWPDLTKTCPWIWPSPFINPAPAPSGNQFYLKIKLPWFLPPDFSRSKSESRTDQDFWQIWLAKIRYPQSAPSGNQFFKN